MITSTSNPLVKELVHLGRRRERDTSGRFIIEGRRPLALADRVGVEIVQQVVCPHLGGEPVGDHPTVEMAEGPFRKISVRQNPDGVLGVARHLPTSLSTVSLSPQPLLLVVEAIEKPGNLGAMLRTCDALGADALIVTDPVTDIHNPNVVRASQGTLFTVPVAIAPLDEVAAWLDEREVAMVSTVPLGGQPPWKVDLVRGVALAIGAEDRGLSAEALAASADSITVPMQGHIDSLNASVTAAVALYEAIRQRQG